MSAEGRRRWAALLCLAGAGVAGCTSANSGDWLHPDWDRLAVEDGTRGAVPDSEIPTPVIADPLPMPDFGADGPIDISLEHASMMALQQNRDLSVAQLTPVVVGAFEQIERGVFDPEVFAEGNLAREEALESARSTGQQFSVNADESDVIGGVRQTLPTGTDVELSVSNDRSISNRAPEQQTARLGLTVTQSLLRGFGPSVNLVAVRQSRLETKASLYELRGFVESLLADTEIAYWRCLLAQRTIQIFERSLEVARQQADQVMQRIEVGVLAQTEAAAANAEVALREQALIDARSDFRSTRLRLFRLINAPLHAASETDIQLSTRPGDPGEAPTDELASRVALAQRMRPDLNEARLRLEQGRLETIRTRNGLLPRLDLFVALGKTGYATTFLDSFSELDGPGYDAAIGLRFSQYIENSAAKGAHEAALATRRQAAAAIVNLEQLVELDVRLAANDAERARQQIDATVTTRVLQEETARAEVERFDVGASTTLLVAQAQRDLLAAQIAEVEAIANYRIALIRLYLAEGSLLERRGVTLPNPRPGDDSDHRDSSVRPGGVRGL